MDALNFEKSGEKNTPDNISIDKPKIENIPANLENSLELEKNQGQDREKIKTSREKSGEASSGPGASTGSSVPSYIQRGQDIDKILADGLEDIFVSLPPEKQKEFKEEGEVTVSKINTILETGKAKIKTIVDLIRRWLSIIPGVNRFFLEQEAKIKADKIIKLKDKY